MKIILKEYKVLAIAFSIPLILIILVSLFTRAKRVSLKSDYDFVYATCSQSVDGYDYGCKNYIELTHPLQGSLLIKQPLPENSDLMTEKIPLVTPSYQIRYYRYIHESDTSQEVSFEDIQSIPLTKKSPEDIELVYLNDSPPAFIPFYENNNNYAYYLVKNNFRKKLNTVSSSYQSGYADTVYLLGWIIK